MAETVLDALVSALEAAAQHNSHEEAARIAVLWPDPDEQWRPLIELLRPRLPLLTLGRPGEYAPATWTGPAYYLRCLVARTIEGVPPGAVPIVYLPGVSRAAVKVREECPKSVLPLVELQYRGGFFAHVNTNEWTVSAFLQSALGVGVGQDAATREAVLRSVEQLAAVPTAKLKKDAPLRGEWFDRLHHPDPDRAVLAWLSDPERVEAAWKPRAWAAFRSLTTTLFDLDPERDGPVTAARRLGERHGRWAETWSRFADSPTTWPGVPDRLRAARPTASLLDRLSAPDRWPQDNELAEEALRTALSNVTVNSPPKAREAVVKLEAQHGARRTSVWKKLGATPLADALAHLAVIAHGTGSPATGDIASQATAWTAGGWRTDLAVLDARACIDGPADESAIRNAVRAMYVPWLDESARAFQKAVATEGWETPAPLAWGPGVCVLFSDGLRFDVAQRLAEMLRGDALDVEVDTRRGALPGVTETGKPALMPIREKLKAAAGFDVAIVGSSSPKAAAAALRSKMAEGGVCIVEADATGDPGKPGWTECGEIDHRGHDARWDLGCELESLLRKIAHRVKALLGAGWAEVRVVTDHGWLVVPGELAKPVEVLPEHLTAVRKGRCARLNPHSQTTEQTVAWHFDPDVRVAVTAGAGCYEAGKGYEHGGLSVQECILPVLTVRGGVPQAGPAVVKVRWKGLRVTVEVDGAPDGATVDVRAEPANPESWLKGGPGVVAADGHATGLVQDDNNLGNAAFVVVLSATGAVVAQVETKVGAR